MNDQNEADRPRLSRLATGSAVIAVVALSGVVIVAIRAANTDSAMPVLAAIGSQRSVISKPNTPIPQATSPSTAEQANVAVDPEAATLRDRLIGSWFFDRHGRRTLTVKADGTATANVQLDTIGAFLYGAQLRLELTWSLDDDVMTQIIESGTPADAARRLARDWGDRRDYRVIRVSADELVLAEVDDEADQQVWKRVAAANDTASVDEDSQESATKQSPR